MVLCPSIPLQKFSLLQAVLMILKCPLNNFFWMTPYKHRVSLTIGLFTGKFNEKNHIRAPCCFISIHHHLLPKLKVHVTQQCQKLLHYSLKIGVKKQKRKSSKSTIKDQYQEIKKGRLSLVPSKIDKNTKRWKKLLTKAQRWHSEHGIITLIDFEKLIRQSTSLTWLIPSSQI